MIQQPENDVKWTQDQWTSARSAPQYQKLTGKKWTKNLEEVDTDATASWSENIDQTLSDVEPVESRIVTIEIMGKTLTVDCLDVEDVKSMLQRLGGFEELRQKRNEIKMVILDSLCKENKLLIPFLERQCKQYSKKRVKQLFL